MIAGHGHATAPHQRRMAGALATAAMLFAAGCGGAGNTSTPPTGNPMEQKLSFSNDDLRHFLVRTHWGVNNADLSALQAQGLPSYVDAMLQFPAVGTPAFEQVAETILYNLNDPPGLEGGFPKIRQLTEWWLSLMEENPNPFQEVMAMFWHGHFSVSSLALANGSRHMMRNHIDLLRGQGVGNLRQLLIDVTRDEAMMKWLDTVTNRSRAPNENFAREFWELYTLGVDNGYTQQDITDSARAFTGYRLAFISGGQTFTIFKTNLHDPGEKTILGRFIHGQSFKDDFEEVVDITLAQGKVAEFITTKLFENFCYENPSREIVTELSDILRKSNWELRPVLKALFKSNAFYSSSARQGFVKSPVDYVMGFVRSTGMRIPLNVTSVLLGSMGQTPTQPPTVEGWLGGPFWLGAQGIVERATFLNAAITSRAHQATLGYQVSSLLPPPGQRSAAQVVDALAALLHVTMTSQERRDYIDYLNTNRLELGAVISSPFTASSTQLDERVRGLLYILGQHPSYMIR